MVVLYTIFYIFCQYNSDLNLVSLELFGSEKIGINYFIKNQQGEVL